MYLQLVLHLLTDGGHVRMEHGREEAGKVTGEPDDSTSSCPEGVCSENTQSVVEYVRLYIMVIGVQLTLSTDTYRGH